MAEHRTIDGTGPIRIIQVGTGSMGRHWLETIEASAEFELAGVVDLNVDAARAALDGIGRSDVAVSADLGTIAEETRAQAVANVTIPAAHHAVTTQALLAGLPVISEKPVAGTLAESLSLIAASEYTGQLFMVSQSRRHNNQLHAFKALGRSLGEVGIATCDFFKAPHFGGFRDEMEHPLLLDMAIHPFDSARYLLDAEPVSVYCEEYNPAWSWYRGDAGATAIFEMTGNVRYIYTASWASPGLETSWNGNWRVSGENGSTAWDGDNAPVVESTDAARETSDPELFEGVGAALHNFAVALRTGEVPSGEVHENILSLVMVEAAIESATADRRIRVDDVFARAHERAVADEKNADIAAILASWDSVGPALRDRASAAAARRRALVRG